MEPYNKIALITGASRGIGAACARKLATQGYALCINYKENVAAAESLHKELEALGVRVISYRADISREEEVMAMFEAIDRQLGRLGALVNNAALMLPQSRLVDMSAERLQRMFTNNLFSYFLCCREAVKRMSTQHGGEGGAIVNISSVAARTGSPNEYIDYAAAKGGVDTLSVGLAKEVAAEGIRVNAVRPGITATSMHADGGELDRIERLKNRIPMGRAACTDEIANAIAWLLSDEASYTSGALLDVGGGF